MLQRLNSKPPTALKPNPNDIVIFNKDGKLKDQYYKICLEINFNPDELYPRTLESFKEPGIIKNVLILRFNNYENKRRAKIEALRNVARQRIALKPPKAQQQQNHLEFNGSLTHIDQSPMKNANNQGASFGALKDGQMTPSRSPDKFGDNRFHLQRGQNKSDQKPHFERSRSFTSDAAQKGGKISSIAELGSLNEKMKPSIANIDEVDTLYEDMEERFKRYMQSKMVHRERLQNAPVVVSKMDDEYREKLKKAYDEKFARFEKKRMTMSMQKKKDEREEEYRREKIERQRELQEEARKSLQERLAEKLNRSEIVRRTESKKLSNRLELQNTTFQEKYNFWKEKQEDSPSNSPEGTLTQIEQKMSLSFSRKKRLIDQRKLDNARHFDDVEERRKRVREEGEEQARSVLGKLLSKMDKKRCQSATMTGKRTDKWARMTPVDQTEDYVYRMEKKTEMETMKEADNKRNYDEKLMKIEKNMKKRFNEWSDLIAERKEIWSLKMENISENKNIVNGTNERYLEQRTRSYKDRIEQLNRIKDIRVKQMERMHRTFTATKTDLNKTIVHEPDQKQEKASPGIKPLKA